MMTALLTGMNAIVTGSNRGIGKAVVERFACHGANVWACARRPSDEFAAFCRALETDFGVWVEPVYFDMADVDAMKEALKEIRAEKLSVDILVNNAGIVPENRLFQMASLDEMELFGEFLCGNAPDTVNQQDDAATQERNNHQYGVDCGT